MSLQTILGGNIVASDYFVVTKWAFKTITNITTFVPTKKGKNERLIEVSEHVAKTYRDLESVGKEREMNQVEHLILKTLTWVDQYHKDEIVDLLMKDEKAQPAQRVGAFKIVFNYLKTTRMNLLKYHNFTSESEKSDPKPYCRVCKKNHPLPYCKPGPRGVHVNSHERQPSGQGAGRGGGRGNQSVPENCKFCGKKTHTFTSTRTNKSYPSTRLYDCPDFMLLDVTARAEYLKKIQGCSVCTSPLHTEADCNSSWQKCGSPLSGDSKCQVRHNRVLHGANSSYIISNLVQINNVAKGPEEHIEPRPVLLFIQSILLRGKFRTSLLYDSGSNTSLITRVLAKQLNLPFKKLGCWVTLATKSPEFIETKVYEMVLPVVSHGREWLKKVHLYEVPGQITSDPQQVDISPAYSLFPGVPKGALDRPTESVGILLGMDCADLMPTGPDNHTGGRKGNLVCMQTIIRGQGFILGGSHP